MSVKAAAIATRAAMQPSGSSARAAAAFARSTRPRHSSRRRDLAHGAGEAAGDLHGRGEADRRRRRGRRDAGQLGRQVEQRDGAVALPPAARQLGAVAPAPGHRSPAPRSRRGAARRRRCRGRRTGRHRRGQRAEPGWSTLLGPAHRGQQIVLVALDEGVGRGLQAHSTRRSPGGGHGRRPARGARPASARTSSSWRYRLPRRSSSEASTSWAMPEDDRRGSAGSTDGLGHREAERTREHREPAVQGLRVGIEEVVAPRRSRPGCCGGAVGAVPPRAGRGRRRSAQ